MKKLFLMAAAAATLFASCAKEENSQDLAGNGEPAKVGFSFEIPTQAAATRAETQISTNDEIKVNRISVFIFDETGAPATLGHYTHFDEANVDAAKKVSTAFTAGTNSSSQKTTFTLNEDYYIETVSGLAHLYVGINLPASLDHAYASEAALWAAKSNANGEGLKNQTPATWNGEGFARAADFTMFGQAVAAGNKLEVELKDFEADGLTTVPVDVERVVSKVVGTTQKAVFPAVKQGVTALNPSAAELAVWDNGLQLEYTIAAYNVYNEMSESFLNYKAGQSVWDSKYDDLQSYFKDLGGNVAPFDLGTTAGKNIDIDATRVYDIAAAGNQTASGVDATLAAMTGFYIGENYSSKNPAANSLSRNGSTTYAMVATTVTTNKVAAWVGTEVVWNDAVGGRTQGTETLYIVKARNKETGIEEVYITTENNATNGAQAILDGLYALTTDGEDMESDRSNAVYSSAKMYTYLQSYVHFQVWLNRDGFNDYNVGRNEFIHVHVTGVTGMDGNGNGLFPGYPGDDEDPKKPGDLDGQDPNDPVDGSLAKLKVVITVKDWKYRQNGGVLSK